MVFKGKGGIQYELDSFITAGGEGEIYNVKNNPDIVAKLYKSGKATLEKECKLIKMINFPPHSVLTQIAWPHDVLYEAGNFVGFTMQKMNINEDLNVIYEPGSTAKYPEMPWKNRIIIAQNLCVVLDAVHKEGHVCGDFNPKNISVNPTDGFITLLDTDSYHIQDGTETYRCDVGIPEYLPYEVQIKMRGGSNLVTASLPTFSQETDRFALAIHIFQLLMNGIHPFGCALIPSQSSVVLPMPSDNIIKGDFLFLAPVLPLGMQLPIFAPPINILPQYLVDLFQRAFVDGHTNPSARPKPEEWHTALQDLRKELAPCSSVNHHEYWNGLSACPFCELEQKISGHFKNISKPQMSQQTFTPPVSAPSWQPPQPQGTSPFKKKQSGSSQPTSLSAFFGKTTTLIIGALVALIAGILFSFAGVRSAAVTVAEVFPGGWATIGLIGIIAFKALSVKFENEKNGQAWNHNFIKEFFKPGLSLSLIMAIALATIASMFFGSSDFGSIIISVLFAIVGYKIGGCIDVAHRQGTGFSGFLNEMKRPGLPIPTFGPAAQIVRVMWLFEKLKGKPLIFIASFLIGWLFIGGALGGGNERLDTQTPASAAVNVDSDAQTNQQTHNHPPTDEVENAHQSPAYAEDTQETPIIIAEPEAESELGSTQTPEYSVTAVPEPILAPSALPHTFTVLGRDIQPYSVTDIGEFSQSNPGVMMGAEYVYGFFSNASAWGESASAYFNISAKYSNLVGLVAPMDVTGVDTSAIFTVLGDGRLLTRIELVDGDPIQEFSIDVTGVTQLEFSFLMSGNHDRRFGMANILLSGEKDISTYLNAPIGTHADTAMLGRDITAFRLVGAREFSRTEPGIFMGTEYEHGFSSAGNAWATDAYVYFNIAGLYTNMSGLIGAMDNTGVGTSAVVSILGDGVTLARFELVDGDPIQEFFVDVTDVTHLRFGFSMSGEGPFRWFGATNISLTNYDYVHPQPNTPLGTHGRVALLGWDIPAFRLVGMREFSRSEPGVIMGAEYEHGFSSLGHAWDSEASAYFNIAGLYTHMSGVMGAMDDTGIGNSAILTITGDGLTLATFQLGDGEPIQDFFVDVTGVTHLRFSFNMSGDAPHRRFGVTNISLTTNEYIQPLLNTPIGTHVSEALLGWDITAFRLVGAREFSRIEPGIMMGTNYEHGFSSLGHAWDSEASAYFNIAGLYTNMSGVMGAMDDTGVGNYARLTISGDGTTLAIFQLRDGEPIQEFSVDVTGVTHLRFSFSMSGDAPHRRFGVANVVLS